MRAAATGFPGQQEPGDIVGSASTHEKVQIEENQVKAAIPSPGGRILGRLDALSLNPLSGPGPVESREKREGRPNRTAFSQT